MDRSFFLTTTKSSESQKHSEVPIPFTVKIRLLPKMEDTLRLCKMLEREGAQLITVIPSSSSDADPWSYT